MALVTGDNTLSFATSINNAGLVQGAAGAQGILRGLANNISRMDIFAGLALGGTIAFTKIATGAFEASKAFETSMLEIQTISKATQENFEGMSEAILEVGLEVPQTADELAKAFYQIASAGFDGAAGVKLLDISARAAVGGVTDVETAADGITTVMNAWKISMDDAETVADKLFKTVELGKTTFPELSNNISQVASIAASASIPLEEILAAVAAMTKQGIPTAQAFTQIKSAIISTNEVLGDGWSKAMSFQEGMIAIADQAGGSQTELREMVGRVEAMNAVLALTGENAELAAQSLDEVKNSTGAAGAAFETMVQSAENQSKLLAANIEAAFRPLGDFILKNFRDVTAFLNEAFESGDIEKFAKIVGVAVSSLVAYKTATALSTVTMMDFRRVLVKARKAMKALNVISKANPWGLIAAGIVAAVTAFIAFNEELSETAKIQEELNAISLKAEKSTAAQKVQLQQLLLIAQDENRSLEERRAAVDALNKISPEYLGNLRLETINTGEAKKATDAYIKSLVQKAQVQAATERLVEIEKELLDLRVKGTGADVGLFQHLINSVTSFGNIQQTIMKNAASFVENVNDKEKELLKTKEALLEITLEQKDANDLLTPTTTTTTTGTKPKGDDKQKQALNFYQTLQAELLKAKQALEDLSGLEDEVDKKAISRQQIQIELIDEQILRQEILLGLKKQEVDEEGKSGEATKKKVVKKKELNQLSLQELVLLRTAIKEELEGLDKTSTEYKKYAELQKAVNENIGFLVSEWMGNGASALGQMGQAIGELNSELGSMIVFAAELLDNIAGIASGIASGNVLQTATSIVKLTVQLFNGERRRQKAQERTTKEIERQNIELEQQLKLLERSLGTDTIKAFKNSFKEIEESLDELERKSRATTTNFWGKTSDKYDREALAVQYEELLDKRFELEQALRETVTGTTSTNITDSILDGFANGKLAAEDFADTFEELMKNAMLESFKMKYLEQAFDDFYQAFADAAESGGGLTASELANLQSQFNTDIERAQSGFDAINTLFEDTFGTGIADVVEGTEGTAEEVQQGLAGSIQASLTEETGTILAGTMNSMRLFIGEQNDILNNMEQHLSTIVDNTDYNKQLDRLENIEALLSEQTQSLRSTGG